MQNSNIYHIIEVANSHGGDIDYLHDIIKEFSDLSRNIGIKFQAFSPDSISTPGYEWYSVYKKLFFSEGQWKSCIDLASKTKDVWLDIFDLYGVTILDQNLGRIHGIKLQTSVLFNIEVLNALKNLNLTNSKLILNISARSLENIDEIVKKVEKTLKPQEIILEFGFQAYPTDLEDCGFSKLEGLKNTFDNKLVFADHTDGTTDDAIWLPVNAAMLGVHFIEKHVMLNRETKYDHFSSLTPDRYRLMVKKVNQYVSLKMKPFINPREINYLEKSLMVPILNKSIQGGSLIAPEKDFKFRRTNKLGLSLEQVNKLQCNFNLIETNKLEGDVLVKSDFRKAKIATIIACRLKSSRLPKKALLKIGNKSSVEFCIERAQKFNNVDYTILATSTLPDDQDLKKYVSPPVIFHTGDSEDVIQRYIDVCDKLRIDVVIRVTADMPLIDNEICQFLLQKHFESGSDYTVGKTAAIGTNLEIINIQALKKVKSYFPRAEYSEYMTWYFQNNPKYFNLNFVELPHDLVRDYRLTLDYKEDLDLFNKIDNHFENEDYTLRDVFKFLDDNMQAAQINSHLTLKYQTDKDLIKLLDKETKVK